MKDRRLVVVCVIAWMGFPFWAWADGCVESCATAFPNAAQALLGSGQDGLDVTIYVDDDARKSPYFQPGTVQRAIDQWNSACGSHPSVPSFRLEWESEVPFDYTDYPTSRSTILIDFIRSEAPVSGAGTHPASAELNLIRVYERCPQGMAHGLRCFGDRYIRWDDDWGAQAVAHEIGHVLALDHDEPGCGQTTVMSSVTQWSEGNLPLTRDHCELAGRINDLTALCNLAPSAETHHCERCRRQLSGSVGGLVPGETVTLRAELTFEGVNKTLRQIVQGAGGDVAFSFAELALEGASFLVTVDSTSNPRKHCEVINGTGTVGAQDVTDVRVTCQCLPGTGGFATTGRGFAAATICDAPRPGDTFDLEVQTTVDLCATFPSLCGGGDGAIGWLDPWWWHHPGPPAPGCGETTCVSDGTDCEPLSDSNGDGEVNDEDDLTCYEGIVCSCAGGAVKLSGPRLQVAGLDDGDVVAGRLVLSGFAEDRDGLAGLRVYVDGASAVAESWRTGLPHAGACRGRSRDCDPHSGFEVVLDTAAWSDGPHRFTLVAVDGSRDHPMPTTAARSFVVDNACAGATPPQVAVTAPVAGEIVVGTVEVRAAASAAAGVERVRFYLDGVRTATDWTAPYTWSWESAAGGDRAYALEVEVLDRCGGAARSQPVVVETANANAPPRMEVEVPVGGALVQGSAVEVSGWAVDGDGVSDVEVRLDGQPLPFATPWVRRSRPAVCDALAAPAPPDPDCPDVGFTVTFDSTLVADGWHELRVLVTDRRGGVSGHSRSLRVGNLPPRPPAVGDPPSRRVLLGDDVSFAVTAGGEGPFSYRWQYRVGERWLDLRDGDRGGRVSGAATARLALAAVTLSDAGGYRCRVSNAGGFSVSPSASLSVLESVDAPVVTAGIDRTVNQGERAELRVTAEGYPPLNYRWQRLESGMWNDLGDGGAVRGADTPTLALDPAAPGHGGQYRCRVSNPGGSTTSASVRLTVSPDLTGSCVGGGGVLCLHGRRFAAEVWIDGAPATAKPYSDVGGLFTLGNPDNVEVAVKVLDGRAVNDRYWLFHGALTSRSYALTVTDTATGTSRSYVKPSGSFCGGSDIAAFQDPVGPLTGAGTLRGPVVLLPAGAAAGRAVGACTGSTTALCLLDSRFRVQVLEDGAARRAVGVSPLSGVFTFGSVANPEVVVKVLDGTPVNDWYWVFFGSLTGQSYEVRVTDTTTGATRSYPSPVRSCGAADTEAF